jgi:hypothetical protein
VELRRKRTDAWKWNKTDYELRRKNWRNSYRDMK